MARAAALGRERGLGGREISGGIALGCQGLRPMAREERLEGLVGAPFGNVAVSDPQQGAGEGGQGHPAGKSYAQPQGLPPPVPLFSALAVPPRL